MSNTPQVEDGFIKLATDIAKYLAKTYMSSYESQIIWAIFIKTYGWNKKEDWISNSQFVELTDMHKSHVSRTVKKLIKRKIVTQTGNKIAFQKNSKLWKQLPKQVTEVKKLPIQDKKLPIQDKKLPIQDKKLPKQADTIYTIQKTITKDIAKGINLFKKINPSTEVLFVNKTQRASTKRLINKYGIGWLEKAVVRLEETNAMPYAPRITTPYELETKLGQLKVFLQQEKAKSTKTGALKI